MRKWLPLVAVCLGSFMLLIDVTIVNVALPDMAKDLSTSFSSLQWVVDAYALALAALLMGIGGLADLTGHRRIYLIGLAVFALSSLACGFAPNAAVLIAARAVQGVGAAAMFATTFALLNAGYQGKDRGIAYGVWGAVSGAAAAIGPVLGGILTQGLNWRWIFFVNLPVSAVAIAVTVVVFVADEVDRSRRLDVAGTLTFTLFAGALTFALIRASERGWTSGAVLAVFATSALALVGFVLAERLGAHPMFDLALLRNRSFAGVLVAGLAVNFAAFAALTYASIWLQSVKLLSPVQAGLTSLPLSAAAFGVSALVGRLLHSARPGPIIGGGLLLVGMGSILDGYLLHAGSSWPALIPGYILAGLGVGLAIPTLSSSAMAAVPLNRGGMAAGAVNTARQLSFAIGIAVLGSVFTSRAESSLSAAGATAPSRTATALSGGQAQRVLATLPTDQRARVDALLHAAAVHGLAGALFAAGAVGLAAGLLALLLIRPAKPAPAAPQATTKPAYSADPATG